MVTLAVIYLGVFAVLMATGADLLLFLGAAFRSVLVRRTRQWTADVAMLGFVVVGVTLVNWAMSSLALHKAVESGNPVVVQSLNILDTTNFPLVMLGMACALIGVGVTALREQALPTWLCWVSIVLGVLSPLGPLAFAPFVLFAVWIVVVAAMIRLSDA